MTTTVCKAEDVLASNLQLQAEQRVSYTGGSPSGRRCAPHEKECTVIGPSNFKWFLYMQPTPDPSRTLRRALNRPPFERLNLGTGRVQQELDLLFHYVHLVSIKRNDLIPVIHIKSPNNRLPLWPPSHDNLHMRVLFRQRLDVFK